MSGISHCWTEATPRAALPIAKALGVSLCVHAALFAALWQVVVEHSSDPLPLRVELTMPAAPSARAAPVDAASRAAQPAPAADHSSAARAPRRAHAAQSAPVANATQTPVAQAEAPSTDTTPDAAANGGAQVREPAIGEQPLDLRVLDWLARYRSYPLAARRARIEGVVQMRVTLLPDGRLVDARVEQSSGHAVLDRAALDLLTRAAPLPGDYGAARDGQVELQLPIVYRMRS